MQFKSAVANLLPRKSALAVPVVLIAGLLLLGACKPTAERLLARLESMDPDRVQNHVEKTVSPDQRKIVDTFGYPSYFSLYYQPMAGEQLMRVDVWYYPELEKKILFVAGQIFGVSNVLINGKAAYSNIRSEDFDYSMDYKDVVAKLKADKVEPVDFANDVFAGDGAKSFVADKVIFTIERGHLTYMQTMGVQ